MEPLEGESAAGRRNVRRVDVVLQRHGNPVEGTADAAFGALSIALLGFLESPRVDRHDRVEPVLVERDPREMR